MSAMFCLYVGLALFRSRGPWKTKGSSARVVSVKRSLKITGVKKNRNRGPRKTQGSLSLSCFGEEVPNNHRGHNKNKFRNGAPYPDQVKFDENLSLIVL